jgi:hypothetical protein
MKIKLEKKDLYVLGIIILFIVGVGLVIAYNPNFQGGNPAIMGHSPDEIYVNISGNVKTLQQAIDDGDFSGGGNIAVDTNDCITRRISPKNRGYTFDCGPSNRVVTKMYSKTDSWGSSDHHYIDVTCCKLINQ